eukprot:3460629-Prymnesium_polylepis.1
MTREGARVCRHASSPVRVRGRACAVCGRCAAAGTHAAHRRSAEACAPSRAPQLTGSAASAFLTRAAASATFGSTGGGP